MTPKSIKLLAQRGSRSELSASSSATGHGELRLARHQAQCRICRHPQREAIEQDYLDWVGPRELAQIYHLAGDRALYRHAHALGLVERRRTNLLGALDRIIERGGEVKPTAGAIVSAIRLSAQLTLKAANSSGFCGKPITLSFAGMPESDAVLARHELEEPAPPVPGEPVPPADSAPLPGSSGLPSSHPLSNLQPETCHHPRPQASGSNPARPSRDRQGADAASDGPGRPSSLLPAASGSPNETAAKPAPPQPAPTQTESCMSTQNPVGAKSGWPQFAGFVRPWPAGNKIFSRHALWRRAPPDP